MRFRRLDLNYLWVLLLALPAVLALFQSGYLDSHDGLFHLYRLQALGEAFQAGVFHPRWFPQFAYGYGHPVLNYYSPLTYYVAELLHMLGAGYILSIKLTFATGFLLSAAFTYLYVREVLGRFPALVAAGVYTYFPYHLADTYLRGALAEAFAFVFLPLCLWAMHRLFTRGRTLDVSLLALSFAGLIATHNLTALMFTPVLLGYLALLWFVIRRHRRVALAFTSFLIVAGLDAFYWLPVLSETRWVGLAAALGSPGYQRHLAPLPGFISLDFAFRYFRKLGASVRHPFYPLGLIYALLILVSIVVLGWLSLRAWNGRRSAAEPPDGEHEPCRRVTWHLLFFLVVTLASIFMMLSYSLPLWRLTQPVLASLQYPWRFMAVTALAVAMVTGSLFTLGEGEQQGPTRRSLRYGLGFGLVAALMFHGLAGLPREMLPLMDSQLSVERMWEEDFAARQIGATWTAEYVPVWVKADRSVVGLPPPELVPFEHRDLSPGEIPEVNLGRQGLLSGQMLVTCAEGCTMRFHIFYFPGWEAYIDGQEAPVYPSGDLALLTVDVPAGEHEVLVRFEDTPPRLAGNVIALLTALGLSAFAILRWRWRALLAVGMPVVLVVGLAGWHVRPFRFGAEPQQLEVNLEDQVKLLGYELNQETYRAGDPVQLTLYWLGLQEMSQNYKVLVHFMDEGLTTMWAQDDSDPVGGYTPTTRWMPGEIVVDHHTLYLPMETPPGTYKLFTGMYEWETVRNLTILTPEAASPNNRVLLGEIEVVSP